MGWWGKQNCGFRFDFLTSSGVILCLPVQFLWLVISQGGGEFSPVILPVSTHSGFLFPQHKPLFWKTINFKSTGNSDAKNNHKIYISYVPSWRGCGKWVMLGNSIPTPNPLLVVLGHSRHPPLLVSRTDYKRRVFTPVRQIATGMHWSAHMKTGNNLLKSSLSSFALSSLYLSLSVSSIDAIHLNSLILSFFLSRNNSNVICFIYVFQGHF